MVLGCKSTKGSLCHDENMSGGDLKFPERSKKKCKEKDGFLRRKWTDLFYKWNWNNDSKNTNLEMKQSGSDEVKEDNQDKKTEDKFGIQQAERRQISRNFLTITALAMVLTTLFLLSPPRTGRWIPGPQNKTLSIQVSDYDGTRTPEEKENQGENIFNVGPGYSYKRIMMTP